MPKKPPKPPTDHERKAQRDARALAAQPLSKDEGELLAGQLLVAGWAADGAGALALVAGIQAAPQEIQRALVNAVRGVIADRLS